MCIQGNEQNVTREEGTGGYESASIEITTIQEHTRRSERNNLGLVSVLVDLVIVFARRNFFTFCWNDQILIQSVTLSFKLCVVNF